MKTFVEWVEENHEIDEDWKKWARNAAAGAAIAGAGMGLVGGLTQSPGQQPASQQMQQPSRYQQAFHSKHKEKQRQDLRSKGDQLRQAGRTSGTFVRGQLQDSPSSSLSSRKHIPNQSVTIDDASSFVN